INIFFVTIFSFLLTQLLVEKNGSYFVQPAHAYGDISLHLALVTSFAYGQNFPIDNPIYTNHPISYPFLIDFITAVFVNPLGLSLPDAVALTGALFMACLIIILSYFTL